jgi:hypothetical protein
LDLEASSEVVSAGLGLMSAAEAGPVECVLDGFRRLTQDVEQACDFGDGEWDHSSMSSRCRGHTRYC